MIKVILYPCPCCTTWNVSEWIYPVDWPFTDAKIIKREHITEFPSIDDARKIYRQVLGTLIESIYDPKTDTYSNPDNENANFVVQGSHGRCHRCSRQQS